MRVFVLGSSYSGAHFLSRPQFLRQINDKTTNIRRSVRLGLKFVHTHYDINVPVLL